ncbi:MAG: zinc-dependent peptidase [Gallionellaceae bacterium]|nr:zinc-dependent peptidase [Gallionellaceae bacterium]
MAKGFLDTLFAKPRPVPAPSAADWDRALNLPLFAGFSDEDYSHLQTLALQLLADKTFTPVADARPTGADIAGIAARAALPILKLGVSWYQGWHEVVLYPAQFIHDAEEMDEHGIVHAMHHLRSGEAWAGGPLILSLDDLKGSGRGEGYDVVIHEFAHKLDMGGGGVNGLPPLHGDMRVEDWAAAFNPAYEDFRRRADAGEETEIDPYAAESPAEFFAVLTEYFFDLPEALIEAYPAVYEQMRRFYRQDPMERFYDSATP